MRGHFSDAPVVLYAHVGRCIFHKGVPLFKVKSAKGNARSCVNNALEVPWEVCMRGGVSSP